jgi:hypothetical protein
MVVVSDSIFMLIFMALDGSGRLIVNGVSWFFLVVWLGKILAALMLEIVGFAWDENIGFQGNFEVLAEW